MVCPKCHTTNPDGTERCATCGGALRISRDAETIVLGSAESTNSHDAVTFVLGQGSAAASHDSETPATPKAVAVPSAVATPPTSVEGWNSAPASTLPPSLRFQYRSALEPGSDFGPRYHIEALLGRGGMGEVYKATDRELGRSVAIKLVLTDLATDPEIMQRFKQELLMASKVSHKNILRIHDLGEVEGLKFISMAYVEGSDLHHVLKQEGRLPIERAVKIFRQLCSALAAAHAEGVLHRDLKPQNVLVDQDDNVYVSDFGLAKSLETGAEGMTRTGELMGTPRYMAPEQALRGKLDHRADLYSLGLILYEMVTGEVPFAGETAMQVMLLRIQEKPRNPKEINPDLPDYLAKIIMRCLEKEPERRYQSAEEILRDLDAERATGSSLRSIAINLPVPERGNWGWFAGATGLVLVMAAFAIPSVRRLILGQPKPATANSTLSGVPPLVQGKYLAILPLRVLGNDPSLNYIAEGLSDAITARLFQMKDLHLASTSETERVKLSDSAGKIARDLGVNLILSGDLESSGDQIRIIVSLQDVAAGRRLWSQEFSGSSRDVLRIEDQVFARLAPALELNPNDIALAASAPHPTESADAYQLYLKGNSVFHSAHDVQGVRAGMDLYEGALKKDHSFALAYAGLADANLQMYRETKENLWAERAVGAAQQAEHLNDNLPEVHLSLGSVYYSTGKYAQAIAELDRALELAPNSDDAYRRLGSAYLAEGRKDDALWAFQKAVKSNPYYWDNHNALGTAYYRLGDYDKAVAAYRHVIELEPDNPAGYENMGNVYCQEGKYRDAIPPLEKALSLQASYDIYSNLGVAYFFLKRYGEAVKVFSKAVELNSNDQMSMGNLGDAYRWSGQAEKAAAAYGKAIELCNQALKINPRDAEIMAYLALYYAKTGQEEQALSMAEHARSLAKDDVNLIYDDAVVHALTGHAPEALSTLREAFQKGYAVDYAKNDPELNRLASNPEFENLVKEFAHPGR